jgi:hypothetical protein
VGQRRQQQTAAGRTDLRRAAAMFEVLGVVEL